MIPRLPHLPQFTSSIACLAYLTYLKEVISCDVSPVAMFIFPTPQCSVTTAATKCNRMTIATKSNSCSWNAIARVYISSVLLVLIVGHSDLLMMIIGSNDAAVGWVASPARAVMATLPPLTVTAMAKVGNTHRQNWSRGCEMATVLLHCVPLWERGGDKTAAVPLSATTPANWLQPLLCLPQVCRQQSHLRIIQRWSAALTVCLQVWPPGTTWGWTLNTQQCRQVGSTTIIPMTVFLDVGLHPLCPAWLSGVRGHRFILSMLLCSPSMGPW